MTHENKYSAKYYKNPTDTYLLIKISIYLLAIFLVILNITGAFRSNPKYLSDANILLGIAKGELEAYGDKSFSNVAMVYRVLGFSNNIPMGESVILILFLLVSIQSINFNSLKLNKLGSPLGQWVFFLTSLILGSFYFRSFSKELIPLVINLFIGIIITRSKSRATVIVPAVVIFITYGFFFRAYWFIVAFLFLAFSLSEYLMVKQRTLRRFSIFGGICFVFSILNNELFNLQGKLNERRYGSELANSAFTNIPDTLDGLLVWPVKIFAFAVPFPFIQRPNFQLLVVWFVVLTSFTFLIKVYYLAYNRNWKVQLLLIYLFSFTLTLGIFEPDYGSFAKHLVPFLPLVYRLMTFNVDLPQKKTWNRQKRSDIIIPNKLVR